MERQNYFEKEEDFLKTLFERDKVVYSSISVLTPLKLTPELLLEKNFTIVYMGEYQHITHESIPLFINVF